MIENVGKFGSPHLVSPVRPFAIWSPGPFRQSHLLARHALRRRLFSFCFAAGCDDDALSRTQIPAHIHINIFSQSESIPSKEEDQHRATSKAHNSKTTTQKGRGRHIKSIVSRPQRSESNHRIHRKRHTHPHISFFPSAAITPPHVRHRHRHHRSQGRDRRRQ